MSEKDVNRGLLGTALSPAKMTISQGWSRIADALRAWDRNPEKENWSIADQIGQCVKEMNILSSMQKVKTSAGEKKLQSDKIETIAKAIVTAIRRLQFLDFSEAQKIIEALDVQSWIIEKFPEYDSQKRQATVISSILLVTLETYLVGLTKNYLDRDSISPFILSDILQEYENLNQTDWALYTHFFRALTEWVLLRSFGETIQGDIHANSIDQYLAVLQELVAKYMQLKWDDAQKKKQLEVILRSASIGLSSNPAVMAKETKGKLTTFHKLLISELSKRSGYPLLTTLLEVWIPLIWPWSIDERKWRGTVYWLEIQNARISTFNKIKQEDWITIEGTIRKTGAWLWIYVYAKVRVPYFDRDILMDVQNSLNFNNYIKELSKNRIWYHCELKDWVIIVSKLSNESWLTRETIVTQESRSFPTIMQDPVYLPDIQHVIEQTKRLSSDEMKAVASRLLTTKKDWQGQSGKPAIKIGLSESVVVPMALSCIDNIYNILQRRQEKRAQILSMPQWQQNIRTQVEIRADEKELSDLFIEVNKASARLTSIIQDQTISLADINKIQEHLRNRSQFFATLPCYYYDVKHHWDILLWLSHMLNARRLQVAGVSQNIDIKRPNIIVELLQQAVLYFSKGNYSEKRKFIAISNLMTFFHIEFNRYLQRTITQNPLIEEYVELLMTMNRYFVEAGINKNLIRQLMIFVHEQLTSFSKVQRWQFSRSLVNYILENPENENIKQLLAQWIPLYDISFIGIVEQRPYFEAVPVVNYQSQDYSKLTKSINEEAIPGIDSVVWATIRTNNGKMEVELFGMHSVSYLEDSFALSIRDSAEFRQLAKTSTKIEVKNDKLIVKTTQWRKEFRILFSENPSFRNILESHSIAVQVSRSDWEWIVRHYLKKMGAKPVEHKQPEEREATNASQPISPPLSKWDEAEKTKYIDDPALVVLLKRFGIDIESNPIYSFEIDQIWRQRSTDGSWQKTDVREPVTKKKNTLAKVLWLIQKHWREKDISVIGAAEDGKFLAIHLGNKTIFIPYKQDWAIYIFDKIISFAGQKFEDMTQIEREFSVKPQIIHESYGAGLWESMIVRDFGIVWPLPYRQWLLSELSNIFESQVWWDNENEINIFAEIKKHNERVWADSLDYIHINSDNMSTLFGFYGWNRYLGFYNNHWKYLLAYIKALLTQDKETTDAISTLLKQNHKPKEDARKFVELVKQHRQLLTLEIVRGWYDRESPIITSFLSAIGATEIPRWCQSAVWLLVTLQGDPQKWVGEEKILEAWQEYFSK